MILQGLDAAMMARLLSLDRPGDNDSWLLFGPTFDAEASEPAPKPAPPDGGEAPLRWAAE